MSQVFAEIVEIQSVEKHPNADKLDLVRVKGFTTCYRAGDLKAGDHVVYFPVDLLIPEEMATKLGVAKMLKSCMFTDGEPATHCRVGACRLKGVPSFGFVMPLTDAVNLVKGPGERPTYQIGGNVDHWFGSKKYEPILRLDQGDREPECAAFHRYTDIERIQNFPDVLMEGELVRITEKIHGTNSRVGVVGSNGDYNFMAGSNRARRKQFDLNGNPSLYWKPLEDERVLNLINGICEGKRNVIVFGEIFGPGVQDLDYGCSRGAGYRVFDISVDGTYLDWIDLKGECEQWGVPLVPLLYCGPWSKDLIDKFTYGPTTVCDPAAIKGKFKDREGIVITPLTERYTAILGGRVILKSVSADFNDRKGGTDNE
jgi:RNA ligase (TIGR02306 family)